MFKNRGASGAAWVAAGVGAILISWLALQSTPAAAARKKNRKQTPASESRPAPAVTPSPLPSDASAWALIKEPARGPARSIGSASLGCLQGAESLPPDGQGYQIMRLSRGRFYGHPSLVDYLQKLAVELDREKVGPMLVGDLGLPRGGWMKSGHASHQTGIDVDIWFWVPPVAKKRSLTLREREVTAAKSLVPVKYSEKLDKRYWKKDVQELIKRSASFPEVDRIFVNAAIKKDLCRTHGADAVNAEWLRKLRPWYAHDDHLHVRLKCPADSADCKKQDPISEGAGCDASLDWWFTQDARDEALKNALKSREQKGPPPIAEGCMPVLMQDFWAGAAPEELEGTAAEKKPASETAAIPDDGK